MKDKHNVILILVFFQAINSLCHGFVMADVLVKGLSRGAIATG